MFHPVGSQSSGVYWRRRLVLLAAVVLVIALIWLTAAAVFGSSDNKSSANGAPKPPASSGHSPATGPSTTASSQVASSQAVTSSAVASSTAPSSPAAALQATPVAQNSASGSGSASATPPVACTPEQLSLQAVAAQKSYAVGDQPVLALRVTNTGTAPCVQDVADSQIELRVYNGASRVWGSHDCMIEPGVNQKVLMPQVPATFTVQWTGLSSQPKCAGTRQTVGAGTYTLYASLAGKDGKATNFSIA
jgi:hypothetical protein